ncbi:adenylate/guanylate cyclase domain-containing protein [Chryseobacterium binzhouense]|uniref:adenylate/guanylate cyclase domain-containing protein n=1 Tax=Chryseobacterium binzhouense TaxID=2593646 RepID=UPI0028A21CC6|nr:adenylate/guanylate cyclase domain-containing protein [Chryseobacterium binzhouense]
MGTINNFLDEISRDIDDFRGTEFVYSDYNGVPNRSDAGLTFGYGETKKGKKINTCVLFVDIRNSVQLTKKHQNETMAKLYTVFTNAVIKAAKRYNGHIRNIIGDRVMVVFEPDNCFVNSVDCAITINHIAEIINNKFSVEFKCGIGIDYGEMKVLKVGVRKHGVDGIEHRGLVWTGKPANYASKLTDSANKEIEKIQFEVKKKHYNIFNPLPFQIPNFSTERTEILSSEQFLEQVQNSEDGKLQLGFFNQVLSYKKIVNKVSLGAILINEKVFYEYKKARPTCNSIVNSWWKKITPNVIKDISYNVFSANLIWELK